MWKGGDLKVCYDSEVRHHSTHGYGIGSLWHDTRTHPKNEYTIVFCYMMVVCHRTLSFFKKK